MKLMLFPPVRLNLTMVKECVYSVLFVFTLLERNGFSYARNRNFNRFQINWLLLR